MAFDPTKFGAVPITGNSFDPANFGAIPITSSLQEPNYFQRVGSAYKKAGQEITSEIRKAAIPTESVLGDITQLGRSALRGVGSIAGAAIAPIIEAPIIKPALGKLTEVITRIPGAENIISKATNLANKYPESTKDFEALINIATLGGGGIAAKEGKLIAKDISQGAKIALTPSEKAVQSNVIELFNKSIKPTAQKTLAQGQRYENNTLEALKTIKNNVDELNIEDATGEIITGRTPQTIQELAQGVEQTKKVVFNQYDTLAKQAGEKGAVISAKPIADEVLNVAQNKALQITNPEVVKYAEDWAKRLNSLDILDTETTQAVIQNLNNSLKAFYRNPTYESATKAAIDAGIVNNFRKALDNAIEGATGKEYQVLKNQYSALKTIENDVTRAAMREARKNIKGLLDYTDIFTSGQMLGGILSLNPAMFTKGAIERGFKEWFKFLNDPNRAITNIFDNLSIETAPKFTPQSLTLRTVQGIKQTPNKEGGFVASPLKNSIYDNQSKEGLKTSEKVVNTSSKTLQQSDVNASLIQEAKKYKTTVNIQDKGDLEYLGRILSEDNIADIKAGKMTNFRGIPYADLAKVNIVSETPKTVAQQLNGKITNIKLKTNTFYHGTSADNVQGIMQTGFRTGASLPENTFRGGGYGKMQNSISLTETPKDASRFSTLSKDGKIVEVKLKNDAKVVSIKGIEDALELEDYISYLKSQKVDAVYIGGGEKELVVINPKAIIPTKSQLTDIWKKANKK